MGPCEADVALHPIRVQLRPSYYADHLYDVDGILLTNSTGTVLHVYTSLLADEFSSGRLRLIHDVAIGYRYFVTSQAQLDRFQADREYGTPYFRRTYHLYPDEDFNPSVFLQRNIHIVD